MALNRAQLMEVPGGPGIIGAIQAGTGIAIDPQGSISIDPLSNLTVLSGQGSVIVTPVPGVGVCTIAGPPPAPDDPVFPAGTITCFFQANAPVGWTKITSQDNSTLRIVSGNGGGTGGTTPFSQAFTTYALSGTANYSSVTWSGAAGDSVISIAETASHSHTVRARGGSAPTSFLGTPFSGETSFANLTTSAAGSNSSHSHSVTGNLAGISPVSMNSVDLSVRYVDFILCQRNAS